VQQRLEAPVRAEVEQEARHRLAAARRGAPAAERARACAGRRRWRPPRRPHASPPRPARTPVTRPPRARSARPRRRSARPAAGPSPRPRVHAAVGVPAAVEHLQVDQRGVDRRHAVRVAADEQRVERERLAHARVLEEAATKPCSGRRRRAAPWRARAREVAAARNGRRPAARIALLVDRRSAARKGVQPRGVARRELRDLLAQPSRSARSRSARLAGPADPVQRVQPAQRHLRVQVQAAGRERLLEHPRAIGQQRGTHVPGEAPSRRW
jgi:hypothetical protein